MKTIPLTMAQALIRFLSRQRVRRDGRENAFFAGVWGIFGHGNVAGIGQALQEHPEVPFYLPRNEQAMVHASIAYAKMKNRLQTFACTSSIGPGATNMVTGAATATVNRLPVLLLPGDIFARRNVAPVLQQLESPSSQDVSVNDTLRPVSRYWDRINRADQLPFALLEAMRVLTSPAETGAVTLALPQDVQTEAWDYPVELFEERIWDIPRHRCDLDRLALAREWIASSQRPVLIAGGGVHYSEACLVLQEFAESTGIAVVETQAGKGALPFDHPQNLGAIGATGTLAANVLARQSDLVICVGTRLSDFTTASKTAFQNPDVRFLGINVSEFDACKHSALALVGDARSTLEELQSLEYRVPQGYNSQIADLKARWEEETDRVYAPRGGSKLTQAEVVGRLNQLVGPHDVIVHAAGSLPGDLHKLWRTRDPKGYHAEYGYSCMGYEVAGGLGIKMAAPDRQVYVLLGDGSYLMMSQELTTAVQEGIKIDLVLFNNHGFGSIGGLSKSLGSQGFGTYYRQRDATAGGLTGPQVAVDFMANAASLGATPLRANTLQEFERAVENARRLPGCCVIVVETDKEAGVAGYESWWDVPVAEISSMPAVQESRRQFEQNRTRERIFLKPPLKSRNSAGTGETAE